MSKTYKTWEVIKELTENPAKKFQRTEDGLIVSCRSNLLLWEAGHKYLGPEDKWLDITHEPVPFMIAFKAFHEHKKGIHCIYKGTTYTIYADGAGYNFPEEWIADGKWYIED